MSTDGQHPRISVAVRVARWSATHPWRAIVGWLVFVALSIGIGMAVGPAAADGSAFWIGGAGKAESIATEGEVLRPATEKILITARSAELDTSEADQTVDDITARLHQVPHVDKVDDPRTSRDGTAVLVNVTLDVERVGASDHVAQVRDVTSQVAKHHPSLRVAETGDGSISKETNDDLGRELSQSEMITLPITLIILFLVFGSLIAAGVPILLALASIFTSIGLYTLLSYVVPDAGGAVTSVILLMGMAFGVDYSLFYLKRIREEREASGGALSRAAIVEAAAATSGRAVVVSAIAVIVSLMGLYLADDVIFASLASGSILVVAVAMISSVTVLPALLAKLGSRVDGRRRRRAARSHSTSSSTPLWSTLLRPAMRRPLITLLVAVIGMIALAAPALGMRLSVEGVETFPRSLDAISTYDKVLKLYPDMGPSHMVAVKVDTAHTAELTDQLSALEERTRHNALFETGSHPTVRTSGDGRIAAVEIPTRYGSNTEQAERGLKLLRTKLIPETLGEIPGARYAVSGEPAQSYDYSQHQAAHLPWVVGFVVLATFVMMAVAFRSLVIGAMGLVLNLLSTLAAWGALTLVFQGSWAEGLLGFDSTGFIGARTPLMIFAILFGLSVDYQIFVVSRVREFALRGLSTREAVYQGITGSAKVVTSAAVVMVSVFVSFMLIDRIEMKQLGFGLAFAVIVDAVVVRIMILPALMSLLGRFTWWPSRLCREPGQGGESAVEPALSHAEAGVGSGSTLVP